MSRKFVRFVGFFLILAAAVMLFSALKPLSLNPPPQNFRFFALQVFTMAVLALIGTIFIWNSYSFPYLVNSPEALPPGDYKILSRECRAPTKKGGRPDHYYVVAQLWGEQQLGDRRWVVHRNTAINHDSFEIKETVVIPGGLVLRHKPKTP